ncbi:FlgD immunoglobulin-like domain containing protein [Streptomyces sp. NPDC050564]|uniref:FlgD immunoglobulin-like domain containing protein n=1 Tax=Streptomyces sp. NPDC050564 TaxID=3365631 RepID=UPI00379C47F9
MTRSRRLAAVALGGAVALTCAVPTTPAQAAPGADTPVATAQLSMTVPTEVGYRWAGASGFRYWLPESGSAGTHEVDYPGVTPPSHAGPDDLATGTDVISTRSGTTVAQQHRSTGASATVTIPAGQTYRAASGWSVLTQDTAGALHVLRAAAEGTTSDLPVTGLPSGAQPNGIYVTGGSVRRLAVGYTLDGATSVGLVDLADGTFRTYLTNVGSEPRVVFNDRWLVNGNKSIRVDSAPGTEPTTITATYLGEAQAVIGDQLLTGNASFLPGGATPELTAVSLTTNTTRTALANAKGAFMATPDGGALVTAGPSSVDWHVYRVTPTEDGATTAQKVLDVPAWQAGVDGLALAGGELLMYGNTTHAGGIHGFYGIPLDTTGRPTGLQTRRSPTLQPTTCLTGDAACPQLEALGDGRIAYLWTDANGQESVNVVGLDTSTIATEPTGDSAGRLGTGSGRYVLYNGGTPGSQKVADFPRGAAGGTALDRTRTAAAIWGQRLWIPGGTQGSVVAYDLKAKKNVATVDTGAPCTPTEIQAVNTWLYWSCGSAGPAGVYDRGAGRAITVPAGQGRLADGYLIRENRTTHELLLTDFHTGTATTRTIAVLPTADQNNGGNTGRWAVDRFGGNVAHLTRQGQVAIVTAGVPTSPLAQTEAQTDPQPGGSSASNPWRPVWQLNKPSAWTLTLSNTAGGVVRTLTGASTAAAVRASWNAQNDSGTYVPRGTYTWKLTAAPRDGQGPDLTLTGTTTVN